MKRFEWDSFLEGSNLRPFAPVALDGGMNGASERDRTSDLLITNQLL